MKKFKFDPIVVDVNKLPYFKCSSCFCTHYGIDINKQYDTSKQMEDLDEVKISEPRY